jgi:predicted O-methyltransferase YrrM
MPIKYLEIGTFFGANLFIVANTYGLHPDSELYCIDPWEDYEDYPEYKDQQNIIYHTFLKNLERSDHKNKIKVRRGYSNNLILNFDNNFFDIVYIDGNHESEYVMEDAVLSFRKLKERGVMIFDDYNWETVKRGADAFVDAYKNRLNVLGESNNQFFIEKLK